MFAAVPRDSLCPSPSGTLIMRPANGPARRLAVSVGGVCVEGVVDVGSCVEVEEKERERERKTEKRCELRRRGRASEMEKIERPREERKRRRKRVRAAAVMTGRPLSKLI